MDAKLVVAKGKTAVKEIPLGELNTIIGRRSDCGLRIPSPLVSRQHCELKCAGNRLVVRDLGSSNGTLVNGTRIKQKELKSGDTLGVGPITFIVQLGGSPVSPGDTARPAAAGEAADFVVAEEVGTSDPADFVVGEETDVVTADDADFVVGEAADDAEADFVAAEATDDSEDEAVADFVVADESSTEADAEVIVAAEISEESDTVHNVNVSDLAAKRKIKAAPEGTEKDSTEKQEPPPKRGLFGRLFKRKEKKSAKDEPAAPAAKPTKPSKTPPPSPEAPPATASETADLNMPGMFVSEDEGSTATSKPVGEDELADFLMGLNEKEK